MVVLYLNSLGTSVSNLLPLVLPPKDDIAELLPSGNPDSPLNIPEGFSVDVFADVEGGSPRVLSFDPRGVLVASLTKKGTVVAFPDSDKDLSADGEVTVISGLNNPHGLVFHENYLYIAESHRVSRYLYDQENFKVGIPEIVLELPSGANHFTRTIKIIDNRLYTSVGSSCNVCVEENTKRAAILVSDISGDNLTVYAKGLRNTVFFAEDALGNIWGADMGRDFLGDSLPPEEINMIRQGDYGWPYCYGEQVRDLEFSPNEKLGYCEGTVGSVYGLPAHIAPLGIAFIDSELFPRSEQGNILLAEHGSWNSTNKVGYKIVKLSINDEKITAVQDFVTGWLTESGGVLGRPVDLIFNENGRLFISDDHANVIYVLTKK